MSRWKRHARSEKGRKCADGERTERPSEISERMGKMDSSEC